MPCRACSQHSALGVDRRERRGQNKEAGKTVICSPYTLSPPMLEYGCEFTDEFSTVTAGRGSVLQVGYLQQTRGPLQHLQATLEKLEGSRRPYNSYLYFLKKNHTIILTHKKCTFLIYCLFVVCIHVIHPQFHFAFYTSQTRYAEWKAGSTQRGSSWSWWPTEGNAGHSKAFVALPMTEKLFISQITLSTMHFSTLQMKKQIWKIPGTEKRLKPRSSDANSRNFHYTPTALDRHNCEMWSLSCLE